MEVAAEAAAEAAMEAEAVVESQRRLPHPHRRPYR